MTSFYLMYFFKMEELISQYINYERNVLNHSWMRESRRYMLKKLNEFLIRSLWKNFSIQDVQLKELIAFITEVKTTPITTWHKSWKFPSPSAIYNYLCCLRMFFKFLNFIWYKLKFNREQIPIYRCPDKKREPMSEQEYNLLRQAPLQYADSELEWMRDELLIEIPRETWLRRAEIVRIRFEDFHHQNRQFQILVKWWRYESVFFSEWLRKKILKFESELKRRYPFTMRVYVISHIKTRDRWRWFTPEKASTTCHKYVKLLQEKWLLNKNITLHQARHSFAMRCVYSWLSQQATTQLMRHKDPKSTLQYYHLNDSRLQSQFDSIQ